MTLANNWCVSVVSCLFPQACCLGVQQALQEAGGLWWQCRCEQQQQACCVCGKLARQQGGACYGSSSVDISSTCRASDLYALFVCACARYPSFASAGLSAGPGSTIFLFFSCHPCSTS